MGVHHLWTILAPVEKHQSLRSLKGKTLAVDLSMWVVENQTVKEINYTVNKPYLRNLFFRVSHLIQLEIQLVFVFEGTAPNLKVQTMVKRNKVIYGTQCEKTLKKKNLNRPKFQVQLRECYELLQLMGIPCIQSSGEAEAMCAYLNEIGLVDGCITDDSDVFLYGARTVYRNFTMNKKDPHVDCYEMSDIESTLGLNRRNLVGLALLLGCDYLPEGVPGIGKESAMNFFQLYRGIDLLQRFEEWRKEISCDLESQTCTAKSQKSLKDKPIILDKGIQQSEGNALENNIKKMALKLLDFPNHEVIDEFLIPRDKAPSRKFNWCRPDFELQKFHKQHFGWSMDYSLKKIFPLITLWDIKDIIDAQINSNPLQPHSIIKSRIQGGIQCFEVKWYFNVPPFWQTVENKILFEAAFPDIVKEFEESCELTKKRQKIKCKIPVSVPNDGLSNPMQISKDNQKFVKNINSLETSMKDLSFSVDVTSQDQQCKDINSVLQFQMEKENFNHTLSCNSQYQQTIHDYNQKIKVNLHETNQKVKRQAYFDLTTPVKEMKRVPGQSLWADSGLKNIRQPTCNFNSSSEFEMDLSPLNRRIKKCFKSLNKKQLIKKSKSEEHLQLMIDLQLKSDENIEMSGDWDSDIWKSSDLSQSSPTSSSEGHLKKSSSLGHISSDINLEKAMFDRPVLENECLDQKNYSTKNDFDLQKKYFQNIFNNFDENSTFNQNYSKQNSNKKPAIKNPLKNITNHSLAPSIGSTYTDYIDIPLADRLKLKHNAAKLF